MAGIAPVEVSSMWPFRSRVERPRPVRSRTYGESPRAVQSLARAATFTVAWAAALFGTISTDGPLGAAERQLTIVALGDSLTAGFGLPSEKSFPARLAQALRDKGTAVDVINAGGSGETASDGGPPREGSVPEATDAGVVGFGATHEPRGRDPQRPRAAAESDLRRRPARRHPG